MIKAATNEVVIEAASKAVTEEVPPGVAIKDKKLKCLSKGDFGTSLLIGRFPLFRGLNKGIV